MSGVSQSGGRRPGVLGTAGVLLGLAALSPAFAMATFSPAFQPSAGVGGVSLESLPEQATLADAAMRGDLEAARSALERGAAVDEAQGDGMTALHWAAYRGDPSMVQLLLDAGADPKAVTRLGDYTPLHLAAQGGSGPVVEALLGAGADPSAASSAGGATPLHFAAAAGSAEAVTLLLDAGADVDVRESARSQTPLMFAAAYDRVAAIDVLVGRGADLALTTEVIDIRAREEEDRADQRRREQHKEAQRVGRGAQRSYGPPGGQAPPSRPPPAGRSPTARQAPQAPGGGYAVEPQEPREDEPLSYADLVGGHGGLTALLHAVREGHVEAALRLIEAGADIDQVSGGDGTSPMLMALVNGHFDLALQLLALGADPNLASDAGTTPLFAVLNTHWAPKARYPQQHAYRNQQATYLGVMDALLEAGADPNARLSKHLWYMSYNFDLLSVDVGGATPFWRAAYATDVDAMRLLVRYGADPHLPTLKPPERSRGDRDDPSGLPPVPTGGPAVYPIHAASGVGYGQGYAGNAHRHVPDGWLPAVRYLVEELGADVNARDHDGYTALHHAAARGDNELILYLVGMGADVTAVTRRGQTTADMANGPVQRVEPFPETVALLESLGSKNNHRCVSC